MRNEATVRATRPAPSVAPQAMALGIAPVSGASGATTAPADASSAVAAPSHAKSEKRLKASAGRSVEGRADELSTSLVDALEAILRDERFERSAR